MLTRTWRGICALLLAAMTSGSSRRRVLLGFAAGMVAVFGLQPPAQANAPAQASGMVVVITGIHVGSPVMGTKDSCNGWVEHGEPVVPVSINAAFFGDDPVGPYATAEWSGGFGSWENHFGTGVAHDHFQHFHITVRANTFNGWHGAGEYTVQGWVQDVGLGGGVAVASKTVYLPPPSPTVAKVKCETAQPLGPQYVLDQVKDAALDKLKELACPVCTKVKGAYDTAKGYSDALDGLLYDSMVDDPPDPNYQSLATPGAEPVLPPPAGLTAAQQTAYTQLVTELAADVAIGRAIYATVNRVWGADNAASSYWHRMQLSNLASLTGQLATSLDTLPQKWAALTASFTGIPAFTVGPSEVGNSMSELEQGLPAEQAAVLAQLGVSDSDQFAIAQLFATYVDPLDVTPRSGTEALSGTNAADLATAMRTWRQWALSAVEDEPPVVTSVSPKTLPTSGGTLVTIEGSHLQHVTGVNFGPSTSGHGQARLISNCQPTVCEVYAPPGHGTVDVIAVGPGGTSKKSATAQVTYREPGVPHVSGVSPAQGAVDGGTEVSVLGSGLEDGRVDFGTLPADAWLCRPTRCTATAPASGLAGPVHVTVVNDAHRSTTHSADQFTYLADVPPPPPAPTVTGVAPTTGSHLGGQQVTITGTHFTGVNSVQFGAGYDVDEFAVEDDQHIALTTPAMALGANDVVVYGPGGASATTSVGVFTATASAPTITSVSPTSGPDLGGTQVTITGTNLTGGYVEIGSSVVNDTVCTLTQCTFTTGPLPQGDPLGPTHVQVATEDGESSPTSADLFTFTRGPLPQVTGLDPETGSAAGGGTLVVSGHNLNGGSVTIGGILAESAGVWQGCSAESCVVTIPAHAAGDVPVVVKTHAGTSTPDAAAAYSYVAPPRPVVTAVSPSQEWAHGIDVVTITGRHLEGGTVRFGSVEAPNAECTSSLCSFYPPWSDTAKTVNVTVETAGGTSATGSQTTFTWIAPTVTSVSPVSGWTDGTTSVTITGTHLKAGTAWFGNTAADETCASETTCQVIAPQHVATGQVDVRVIDASTTTSVVTPASKFTYTARPLPTVTSVSPNQGNDHGHETVLLTGTSLTGATVTVGGQDATSVDCGSTSCTFLTPASDTDGPSQVVATTSAGSSATGAASTFTYQPPTVPTITSVSPASGSTAGGTELTVTGTDLAGTVISIGTDSQEATCDRASCTVTTSAHAADTLDVTAESSAGTSTTSPATKFTFVVPPAPTITGLSPATGPASGGTAVTLDGHDLRGGQVTFAGTDVGGVTCTNTRCTFTQPPGPIGDVDITVTTDGGTSLAATFNDDKVTITEHDIPGVTDKAGGGEIIRGIGGDMWFPLPNDDAIGRVRADGTIDTYPTPAGSEPFGITYGPDGRMWFTERGTHRIGAMDGNGTVVDFPVPGGVQDLRFITTGPDGRLWFNLTTGAIGAITTTGQVTEYQLPDPSVVPYHLLAGRDGRIWFTEWGGSNIGAITTDGVITEYPLTGPDLLSWDLKTGPDGRLWFTQNSGQAFAAVDTVTGYVTTYRLPASVDDPQGMVWGPDGRFWFVTPNIDRVCAWDPATGDVAYYPLPPGSTRTPKYIAMDGDGDLWVTEVNGSQLVSVTGVVDDASPVVSALAPQYGAAGTQVTVTGSSLGTAQGVKVGGVTAAFTVIDPAHLSITIPAGSGVADVRVTTAQGISPTAANAAFHYGSPPPPPPIVSGIDPPSGPLVGGNTITVTGEHLAGASLKVGTTVATAVSCSTTSCLGTVPAGSLGTVHVVATTTAGSSATSSLDDYTYLAPAPAPPTVTAISPSSGPASGGTTVSITGSNLAGGTVRFGLGVASGSCTANACTAISPAGAAGVVHVRVSTAGGVSPRITPDRFSYQGSGSTAPTTPPGAPRNVTAKPGRYRATLQWSKPASPGTAPITKYVVVTYRGTKVVRQNATHGVAYRLTVTALRAGVGYRFKVYAVNEVGSGTKSAYTKVVKPTK